MTRHMRNAVIVKHRRKWFRECIEWSANSQKITTPVAIAFTEDEVKALAKFLRMIGAFAQLEAFADTSEEAANIVSATNAITAAADDIEADDFEPLLHEEDA